MQTLAVLQSAKKKKKKMNTGLGMLFSLSVRSLRAVSFYSQPHLQLLRSPIYYISKLPEAARHDHWAPTTSSVIGAL